LIITSETKLVQIPFNQNEVITSTKTWWSWCCYKCKWIL